MTEFAFFSGINDVLSEFASVRNMSECRGDIMTIGSDLLQVSFLPLRACLNWWKGYWR